MGNTVVQKGAGYTLFVLFLVNFLNFFDRALPGVVLEPIRKEFGLSDTMLGLLGTAFILIYAVAGIPLGRLSDRFQRTRLLSVGVAAWSVFTGAAYFVCALGCATGRDLEFGSRHHFRHLRLQTLVSALAQTDPAALAQGDVRRLDAARTGAQNGAGGCVLCHQDQHGRHHGLRLQGGQHWLGHQPSGHARGGGGGQAIDVNIVFCAFNGQCLH